MLTVKHAGLTQTRPLPSFFSSLPCTELYDQSPAWLAYAAAKQAGGDLPGAELAAQSAAEPGAGSCGEFLEWFWNGLLSWPSLQTAALMPHSHQTSLPLPAGTPARLLAEAVRATMQLQCTAGRPGAALAHLQQQLPALRAAHVLSEDMEALWATAAAAAAAARDPQLLQQALDSARAWAVEVDADSAPFLARLESLQATASLALQQAAAAARQYSRAAHLCPTSAPVWAGLAASLLLRPEDGSSAAEAALRLADAPLLQQAGMAAKRSGAPVRVPPTGKV